MDSKTCSPTKRAQSPCHSSSSQSEHLDYHSFSPYYSYGSDSKSSTPRSQRREPKQRSRSAQRLQSRRPQSPPPRYSKAKGRDDDSKYKKNARPGRSPPLKQEERKMAERSPDGCSDTSKSATLFCTNLPKVWTEKDAFSYFDKYVKVLKTHLHSSSKRNDPRCMYVTVRDQGDAYYVIKELDGRKAKPTVRKEEKPDQQMVIRIVPRTQDFRLIVRKAPKQTTLEEIRGVFEFYGVLKGVEEVKGAKVKEFLLTYSRPQMAHQAKSVLAHKPFSMGSGKQGPLQVEFERENAETKIKKLDPKFHLTYPINHNFQEKYLKSVYYAYKDEKRKKYFFNPALGLTQYNRPSHHEFLVIGEEESR